MEALGCLGCSGHGTDTNMASTLVLCDDHVLTCPSVIKVLVVSGIPGTAVTPLSQHLHFLEPKEKQPVTCWPFLSASPVTTANYPVPSPMSSFLILTSVWKCFFHYNQLGAKTQAFLLRTFIKLHPLKCLDYVW